VSKQFLSGEKFNPQSKLQDSETKHEMEKQKQDMMLENIPKGITFSKLEYPHTEKGKMSTIILLGVK